MNRLVVASDIEYTLELRDFGYEVLARVLGELGKKLYAGLSGFDDVLGLFPDALTDERLKTLSVDYVPGTTPLLILPFVAAFCEFNRNIVEDLAEITDLRINRGVPELVRGLQDDGAHVVLISSACDAFARRSASVLNLPYWYASNTMRFGEPDLRIKKELRDLAIEIARLPHIEFKEDKLTRSEENSSRIREFEGAFLHLGEYVDLEVMVRAAMGGRRKVGALNHALQYAVGQFSAPLEGGMMPYVVYWGDSITDEYVLREVSRQGGLAVSVNGNAFALANADVAVVSKNLGCLRPLAVKFAELGKSGLLAHITDNTDSLAEEGVFVNDRNPALRMLSGKMRGDLKGEKAIIN